MPGGGSKSIKPTFLTPPDIGMLRPDFAQMLMGLMSGGPFGNVNPLQNAAMQQYQGLMTGQGPRSPATSAYQTLLEATETGLPANTGPIAEQAYRNFGQYTAPAIREGLGAQYGIRFGTPVSESISRAGADVTSNLNAEFARLSEAAQGRRFAAAGALPGIYQGGAEMGRQPQMDFWDILTKGIGTLSGQGQFANPAFGPNTGAQNAQAMAAIITAIATAASSCWIAEAIWGINAPETWRVRLWVNYDFGLRWYGRPVLWLYKRFGRRIAKRPFLVRLLKPLFEAALRAADHKTRV